MWGVGRASLCKWQSLYGVAVRRVAVCIGVGLFCGENNTIAKF